MPAPPPGSRATDELIAHLASAARPVRRTWSPAVRLAVWTACEALVVLVLGARFGVRPDLAVKLHEPGFVLSLLLLAGAGVAAAVLALAAAVPDRGPARRTVISLIGVTMLVASVAFAAQPPGAVSLALWLAGWPCAARTGALALLPAVVLLVAIRRGATLVPALAGLLAGAAAFAIAAVSMRLVCPADERWHLLGWHLAPVAIGIALSGAIGARVLGAWLPTRRGRPVSGDAVR